jgi:putative SOS response-associated peptidase YedK
MRAETVDTAPSFRQAFMKRRCLIPGDGFYVWKKVPGGKIPHSISMEDDSLFVFAGLWERWKDPASGEWFVRQIHTHMPVILPEEHHDSWLSGEAGKEVLVPFAADRMKAWPISSRVIVQKMTTLKSSCRVELESVLRSENQPQPL